MFYEKLAEVYHHVFPVEGKLPLLESVFHPHETLLDIGCSDGRVALALSQSGHELHAFDLSDKMVEIAHEVSQDGRLFSVKKLNMLMLKTAYPPKMFDGAFCIGNTLVHLNDEDEMARFIEGVYAVLKEGGQFLIQILNYDVIENKKIDRLPLIDNDHVTFERYYFPIPPHIKFSSKLVIKATGETYEQSTALLPLKKEALETLLLGAGFKDLTWYSGFDCKPFDPEAVPLLVVARK